MGTRKPFLMQPAVKARKLWASGSSVSGRDEKKQRLLVCESNDIRPRGSSNLAK